MTAIAWQDAPGGTPVEVAGMDALSFGEGEMQTLYFPGGGYVFGSPRTHRGLCAALAEVSGTRVIALNYPKAPEHRWPAQKEAALRAVDALSSRGPLGIAGDSAGGHLGLLTALRTKPVFCAAFSPNTLRDYDLTESHERNSDSDKMVDPQSDHHLAELTFGHVEGGCPEQNLIFQDLTRLPRTYVSVGTDEVLLDDARVFVRAAHQAGASVTLEERPGFHMEELFAMVYEPGLRSVQKAGRFIRSLS
jgi:acetyl esterase/lipase